MNSSFKIGSTGIAQWAVSFIRSLKLVLLLLEVQREVQLLGRPSFKVKWRLRIFSSIWCIFLVLFLVFAISCLISLELTFFHVDEAIWQGIIL